MGDEKEVGRGEEGSRRCVGKITIMMILHPTFAESLVMHDSSK